MEQVIKKLSTYSADWAGVCSALYELGGMLVIHDASGCNSTYTTFDEPRWGAVESMFYISGLTEMEAITGNDEKLIGDVERAARELHPAFIALAGSPIPSMIGADLEGVAALIEERTGIPCFGFSTNGMRFYPEGAALALEMLAERFCTENGGRKTDAGINILGVTPLDYSITGNAEEMKRMWEKCGFPVVSLWAMGSGLDEIRNAGSARVNVVVSAAGILAARVLYDRFQIPYVIGAPVGRSAFEQLRRDMEQAVRTNENQYLIRDLCGKPKGERRERVLVIGEQVIAGSIRYCLSQDFGFAAADVLCPLKTERLLREEREFQEGAYLFTMEEDKIEESIRNYDIVIADPMYRAILPKNGDIRFIDLPHEAFSSRIYRKQAPVFVGTAFLDYITKNLQ